VHEHFVTPSLLSLHQGIKTLVGSKTILGSDGSIDDMSLSYVPKSCCTTVIDPEQFKPSKFMSWPLDLFHNAVETVLIVNVLDLIFFFVYTGLIKPHFVTRVVCFI